MQFAVLFQFAVYYNETEAQHALPTLLHFLLVGLLPQSGQVIRQFNFISLTAIRFQVARRHASKRDGSCYAQLKPRVCYF